MKGVFQKLKKCAFVISCLVFLLFYIFSGCGKWEIVQKSPEGA